jgi:polyisoprenoid-binding protein YceI
VLAAWTRIRRERRPPAAAPPPLAPVAVAAPSGLYHLDPAHGQLLVKAFHFGLSHYTLRLTKWDAAINFNAAHPEQSAVTATAEANSVQTDYPGPRNFDTELENAQWLDAGAHPQLTFVSKRITLTGGDTGTMTGDLTVRGVTRPVTFNVRLNGDYARHPMGAPGAWLGFSAEGSFKRSDYGMNVLQAPAGSPGAGVSDDVEIVIEAEFNNNPSAGAAAGH